MIKERFRGNLDNASALMRFKSRNGLQRSAHVTTCGYIAMVKLKAAITREFTDDHFKRLIRENNYAPSTRVGDDKRNRIFKLVNKIDRLPYPTIEALYKTYEIDGIMALIRELNKPIALLKKNQIEIEE